MAKWICKECSKACNLITDSDINPNYCVASGIQLLAWKKIKDTGCPACDKLPGVDRCLKCQKEEADAEVVKAMDKVEEIEQKEAKEKHELSNSKK